ncbi:MAG TPA: class II aldolase/adducin family protein [Candidatus Bathyarchaeia archaeon]|nr:class II aldolase/adducin family protein [Candidatus Bathyarchaeia archaeon]
MVPPGWIDVKKDMIAIGRLLWEKDLTAGLSGNISVRLGEDRFAITATQTCLGLLRDEDVVLMRMGGEVEMGGRPSSEWRLHRAVYQGVSGCDAIVHVHALYTNAFFLRNDRLEPKILEAKFRLGNVGVVNQTTLNVEDCGSVVMALQQSPLAVLRNHGSLAVGKNLFDCFVLLQTLEEEVKTDVICRLYS